MRVVATAGHVDHGKSTLLRALTGMEPDRWREERERGLTIDLGFVWTDLAPPADDDAADPVTVAFVDVPGHERFIANMLAGAGAVTSVLFVVAADDGWSAQSQEHLDILDLLDIRQAVVAVTKRDVAGADRAGDVADDVTRRIAATSLAGAPLVVTDAVTGQGLEDLVAVLYRQLRATPPAADRRRPRLWVDRSFTISGAGTVVTGTLGGGAIDVGDDVRVLPVDRRSRVRGLQALDAPIDRAPPGSRVAVNLSGIAREEVGRGDALVGPGADWFVTDRVDAHVRALPGAEIEPRGAWHLHVGSAEVLCSIHPLLGDPVRAGSPGFIRIELDHPLPLQTGDRFVLREAGRRATLGGGEVVDPDPGGDVRGADQRIDRVEQLEGILLAGDRLAALVSASGGARPVHRARGAAGVPSDAAIPEPLMVVGDHLVHTDHLARWSQAVTACLATHHAESPDSLGLRRTELVEAATAVGAPASVADAVVDHLAATGTLHRYGAFHALPDHAAAVGSAVARRREELLARLSADPLSPPKLDEAAASVGIGYAELQRLEQEGELVRCGDLAFTHAAVEDAVERLRELEREVGAFTAAQAKDAWTTTRRYAIPLLEHLDAAGVTRFDGKLRTLA